MTVAFPSSRPNISVRVIPKIPATMHGVGGIGVSKKNGVWTIEPDWNDLQLIAPGTLLDPTTKELWVHDPVTDTYYRMTLGGLGQAMFWGTSTTSLLISAGSKTFTTQSGKDWPVGSFVQAINTATPTNYMIGQVTAYAGTTLTMTVLSTGGSGTFTDWTLVMSTLPGSGPPGATGASSGLNYNFVASTSGDPGPGGIGFNSASMAGITSFRISNTDRNGVNLATEIASWDDSTSSVRAKVHVYSPNNPSKLVIMTIAAPSVSSGSYVTFPVAGTVGSVLPDVGACQVELFRTGDTGATGPVGGGAFLFVSPVAPVAPDDNTFWWDTTSGLLYIRYNDGDTTQWVLSAPVAVAPPIDTSALVHTDGSTAMTGNLTINKVNAAVKLNKPSALSDLSIIGYTNNSARWSLNLGNGTPETGGNAGADFGIARFSDAGAFIDNPISFSRATGLGQVVGDPTFPLGIATKHYVDTNSGGGTIGYSGLQINGSMEVDQLNLGSVVSIPAGTTVQTHSLDGWYISKTGTSAFSVQQVASVFPGYTKELKLTVTTAQPSIGTDAIDIRQAIEGNRVAKLAWGTSSAQPLTIGLWVKSSVAGIVSLIASNSTLAVNPFVNVTIVTPGVPQFVTATFPAQTSGTWLTDTGAGIIISVRVAAGGGINIAASNGNTFEMTGVVIVPGTVAPTAVQAPLIMRPYADEVLTCQRYWHCSNPDSPIGVLSPAPFPQVIMVATVSYGVSGAVFFPAMMRVVPSIRVWCNTVENQTSGTGPSGPLQSLTGPLQFVMSRRSFSAMTVFNFPWTPGNRYSFDYWADARL